MSTTASAGAHTHTFTAPAGPKGPAGPPGATGPAGPAGSTGWITVRANGTDDTAAINAAMANAAGALVWLPDQSYHVTTLTPVPGCAVQGNGGPSTNLAGVVTGTTIFGTAGAPIIKLSSSGDAVVRGDFRFSHLRLSGGLDSVQALSYVTFCFWDDVAFISPSRAGIYFEGAAEEWYFRNCKFDFGQYGIYFARVLNAAGFSLMDKFQFLTTRFDAQSKNNLYLNARNIDGNTWMDCTFQWAGEHAVHIDGGAMNNLFIQCTTEGTGQSGKNALTTATVSGYGATTATLASAVGFAIGDPITICGAGDVYGDHSTVIDGLAGNVVTLHDFALAGVTNAPATNASFDEYHFAGDGTYNPVSTTFIGCLIAGEGQGSHLRYSIRAYGTTTLIGVANASGVIPVYDPGHWVTCIGEDVPIRQNNTYVGQAFRQVQLSGMHASQAAQHHYNVVPSAPGGNLILGLRSNTDAYGPIFGSVEVRTADLNHTLRFGVTGAGDATASGRLTGRDGVTTLVKNGPVTDADFALPPLDGTMAVDLNGFLYARVGGAWKKAALG